MSSERVAAIATSRGRHSLVDLAERYALIVSLAAMLAVFSILRPDTFFTWSNLSTILGSQAVLVVVTLGLIVPLTANDFDVSIAYVLTLSAMIVAVLNAQLGWPVWAAASVAIAMGLLVGAINAFFITVFRIHSLIVTLGVGTFLHGVTLWISGSMTISGIANSLMNAVIVWRLFGIPLEFFYALILCAAVWYIFEYTALGQRMLFVGRGREVARLSGINTDRM
ncbi:MAG TPA: ABC transporter permease, partial [Stellaceae bacterium]|nr:ABC transporter permease [Stellaceae bacterium]